MRTADGCGMVMDKTHPSAVYIREALSKVPWGGACIDGLTMGEGLISSGVRIPGQPAMLPARGWTWYGRMFGPTETRWENGQVMKAFIWEDKNVSYRAIDSAAPVWSKNFSEASLVNDGDTLVMTSFIGKPTITVNDLKGKTPAQNLTCPDTGSTKGCEALWLQHAGPVIQRVKAFVMENEPKARARMQEIEPIVAQWKANLGTDEVARREENARRAAADASQKASEKMKWDQECWAKLNKAPSNWGLPSSDADIERARYLQNLFKGECAGHHYAKNALAEADKLLANVPKLRAEEQRARAAAAAAEKDEAARREQDRQNTAEAIGALAGAVVQYQQARRGDRPGQPTPDSVVPQSSSSASSPTIAQGRAGDRQNPTQPTIGAHLADCIKLEDAGKHGAFLRNTCNQTVSVRYCVVNPKSSFSCERRQFASTDFKPNSRGQIIDYAYDGRGEVRWTGCTDGFYAKGWNGGPNDRYLCVK